MKINYRNVIGVILFITGFVTLFFGGRFTINGYAMFGIFLIILALIVIEWPEFKRWTKYGAPPKDGGQLIDLEPWIEKPEARTSIIIQFPSSESKEEEDEEENSDK